MKTRFLAAALVAAGGAGPMHGASVARGLGCGAEEAHVDLAIAEHEAEIEAYEAGRPSFKPTTLPART